MERVVCLSFDEMSTQATEFDEKKDRVLGLFTKMQVIMARSLFGPWKQAVFADFDFNMTVDRLREAASLLHKAGYTVAATVCDCGGPNVELLKALNITPSNTAFPHPITNEPIFVFADAPHLIKLFLNWLLRPEGLLLGNGKTVTIKPLQELLKVTRSEINSMFKFTPRHLYLSPTEKQNVRTAVQLLSATVAQGLSDYIGSSKNLNVQLREEALQLSKVITIVNNWFDVMNSRTPNESICYKKPYGLTLEYQNRALDEMEY